MVDAVSLVRGGRRPLSNLPPSGLRFRIFGLDIFFSVTVISFLYGLYVYDSCVICETVWFCCTGMFLAGAVIEVGACWYVEIVAQRGMCTRRRLTPGLLLVVERGYNKVISSRLRQHFEFSV